MGSSGVTIRLAENAEECLKSGRDVIELTYRYSVTSGDEIDRQDYERIKTVRVLLRKKEPGFSGEY